MGAEAESSLGVAGAEEVNVNIRCSNGSKFSVKISLESTVAEFKGVLAQSCDVPAQQQRLIYKGRILKDDLTLASYGLQADHSVHMVRSSAPTASHSSVPINAGNTNSQPVTQGGGTVLGGTGVAGSGSPTFPGLGLGAFRGTGELGLFGDRFPESDQMQQELNRNMRSFLSNPEVMRSLIMSNPQMREIIDRNPELAHILNDPSILRQTLEASRNPELMREMMRNTDRAMSNIESSPEGFNMLRRMYENVQEPFLNATTTGGGGTGAGAGANPFSFLFVNQVSAQTGDVPNSNAGLESGTTMPNSNPLPNPWSNTGVTQTNNATRTNPTGQARLPSIAGLGGIGLPEMDRIGTTDPSSFSQLLQNPAVAQITQSLLSNPQYMEQILGFNPQLRSMLDTNPQLREMMQNPEILRELISPEAIQQMMTLQQQLSQLTRQQSTPNGAQNGQGTQNIGLETLMNMFGGLGAGSLAVPNNPDVPPEELYANQLSQLQEMGFYDTQENIRALRATSGNVHAAVDRLLGNSGQ